MLGIGRDIYGSLTPLSLAYLARVLSLNYYIPMLRKRDSNSRPPANETGELPLLYSAVDVR